MTGPAMVPVLVSFTATVEVHVARRAAFPGARTAEVVDGSAVRTALAYVTPPGFTVEEVTDWEVLPS